jgi:hypothetical protein
MTAKDKVKARTARRKRTGPDEDSPSEQSGGVGQWVVAGLAVVAVGCVLAGCLRHGWDWKSVLAACASLAAGVGFVAIGLLELEWLERVIGFVDGIVSGLLWWFWTSWHGTLSDSEWFGRRGAAVFWVVIGVPVFVWGCLLALRVVGV